MKTKLLLFIALALILAGCLEIDTTSNDQTSANACQLTSSTTTLVNASGNRFNYTLNYTYNENGLLTGIASPDSVSLNIRLAYDDQNRLLTEKGGLYTWAGEYDARGRLVKQTRTFEFAPGRTEVYYLEHQYSPEGQLQESRYYAEEQPADVLVYTYRYTYSNGHLAGVEQLSEQDGRYYSATILTDGKASPLPTLPMHLLYMFRDEILPVMGLLEGNRINYSVHQGEGNSGLQSFTASYTYNDAGYPTSFTRTYANGTTEQTSYTYGCR